MGRNVNCIIQKISNNKMFNKDTIHQNRKDSVQKLSGKILLKNFFIILFLSSGYNICHTTGYNVFYSMFKRPIAAFLKERDISHLF